MNTKQKFLTSMVVVALTPLLFGTGCIADRIMDSQDRKAYSEYRMESERINLEREKAGLQPQSILPYQEWKGGK